MPTSLSSSIVVARPADELYDLVTDIGRTGEWSPICQSCWWDEGDGPRAGAWFTGRNVTPSRTWETRSQVEVAERGREFAWLVAGGWVRWSWSFRPVEGGTGPRTEVTESWEFRPEGLAGFRERYGDDADAQIADRTAAAERGIPETLQRFKQVAEAQR